MAPLVLAGDVGGTKANLGLFDAEKRTFVAEERFPSADPGGLSAILKRFLEKTRAKPEVASFGIAGPVVDGHVKLPNLPWEADAAALGAELGIRVVTFLNDLEATAYGAVALPPQKLRTLQP